MEIHNLFAINSAFCNKQIEITNIPFKHNSKQYRWNNVINANKNLTILHTIANHLNIIDNNDIL